MMPTFEPLMSLEAVEQFIVSKPLTFLFILMPNCSVCHGLEPQIKNILDNYPKIDARKIDASDVQEVAGRFNVFTAPVLLLFVDGKEYLREARIVQTAKLNDHISRIYKNMVE